MPHFFKYQTGNSGNKHIIIWSNSFGSKQARLFMFNIFAVHNLEIENWTKTFSCSQKCQYDILYFSNSVTAIVMIPTKIFLPNFLHENFAHTLSCAWSLSLNSLNTVQWYIHRYDGFSFWHCFKLLNQLKSVIKNKPCSIK